jgi:DNA-binding MarR family transcriptional regulator
MTGRDRQPPATTGSIPAPAVDDLGSGSASAANSAGQHDVGGPAAGPAAGAAAGRYAYDGLERVIHERARLSILSSLASNPQGLAFNDLKQLCHLTDGNLSRQLQLLQESAFVAVTKSTKNNRPHTQVALTAAGRERFLEYIAVLESVVADATAARDRPPSLAVTLGRPAAT